MSSSSFPTRRAPRLDADELAALRAFAAVLERLRPRIDAALEAMLLGIPAFARLQRTLDASTRERRMQRTRSLERRALIEGDWEPFLASLREQGVTYAQLGIAFEDWFALLRPYRDEMHAALLPAGLEEVRAALSGMDLFLDRAMAALGTAYVEAKQDLVRKAEAELGLYVRHFEESPLGKLVLRWDGPGVLRVVAANPTAAAMTEGALLSAAGKTLSELGVAIPELVERCTRAAETGEAQRWTWRTGVGAEERIYDARCYTLGVAHVGAVFEDVTERRRMQEALARHAAELERSNRELDEFAYVASHDLKAPLRDIDTLAGWIEEDAGDVLPEGSRRHLKTLRDRIARMERLLEDLLQYSRAGRVRHEPEEVHVRRLVEDAVVLAALPPGFTVVVAGAPLPLCVPRVPLELVLRNLLANAAKHHDRADGRVEVTIRVEGESLEVAVADDGPGVPPEFHERIFAMFQTLKPRDEVEGSGMGLAVVKKIVEAHGGRVWVESQGRGATFRMTWPLGARRSR
ncbi:MAG TPA: ATP-binding protein [Sandaracinaceae bacterium]